MYRSASPYQAQSETRDYQPRPYSPAPGASPVVPGSMTYTTSVGSDGRTIYHPFKAVAASYQTPSGIVSGIQWVPAEATQILPAGAQPATTEFAASWGRGQLGRDDEKALNDWGRDEEKRRRKDEKEARRLREQGVGQPRIDQDVELRKARERDAQSAARERRKSFNAGVPAGYAFPPSGSTGYPSPAYPPSQYSGYGDAAPAYPTGSGASGYSQERKYGNAGAGYSDIDRQLGNLDLDRDRDHGGRERKVSGVGRSHKYSTSETGGERPRVISGSLGARPEGYSTGGLYGPTMGPYNSSMRSGSGPHASPNLRAASPNLRPSDVPYAPTGIGTGYPGSNYSSSPARGHNETLPRSTTPFGGGPATTYPRGHVMEGQPIPRSRAASPMPGAHGVMGPPVGPYSSGSVTFPQPNASPNMSGAIPFPGEPGSAQLAAPEGFSRPVNAAHPFTPFDIIKVQDMEKFWAELPRMPAVLAPHDVFEEDWVRLMQDVALAWAGKLPVPDLVRSGRPPRRSTLIADLVDLWNASFFLVRGVELVLYKGKERRSGPHAGVVDRDLPYLDEPDDYPSSDESELEESNDSDSDYGAGRYNVYGRTNAPQLSDVFEAGRRRKEAKIAARAARRRKRHEKNRQRREKFRERKYSLYLTYVPSGMAANSGRVGSGMMGGLPGSYGMRSGLAGGYSPGGY